MIVILSKFYNKFDAYKKCLFSLSYLFYISFSLVDLILAFQNNTVCYETKKIISLLSLIQSFFIFIYYNVYLTVNCFCDVDEFRNVKGYKILQITYICFHILILCMSISFLCVMYLYYNELCVEWFEIYKWLSNGTMVMFSSVNIMYVFVLLCLSTKENIEILKTNRRIHFQEHL